MKNQGFQELLAQLDRVDLSELSFEERSLLLARSHFLAKRVYALEAEETVNEFGVLVFGSAREYAVGFAEVSRELRALLLRLAQDSVIQRVITGGGPAVMAVANAAAVEAGIKSLRVPIPIPGEEIEATDEHEEILAAGLDMRVSSMESVADVVLVPPIGGYGTLYEAIRIASRGQLQRITAGATDAPFLYRAEVTGLITPVVTIGPIWKQLESVLEEMEQQKLIYPEDHQLIKNVSDYESAERLIREQRKLWDAVRGS